MTKEQLDNIRARHAEGFAPRMSDATLLLAEVERLRRELDKATDDHIESQRNGAREAIARKAAEAEVERLTAELHRMKSRPVEVEFWRLDTMWQQLVRERDEAVHELRRLKGAHSEVNTAKLNDAFTEGTLKAGDAMRPLIADAFKRGVAAMRESAAHSIDCPATDCPCNGEKFATYIRALPDPEDTP